jgi:putative NADPH-quinone reductase
MSEQERMQYHNVGLNRAPIGDYADRLLAAEGLVLIYPVWNEGFPAILKGFFDRVFIPGVSFNVGPDRAIVPICKSCVSSPQFALTAPLALSVSCLATRPSGW